MTLGSHQKPIGNSQTHLTPRHILQVLGDFDLDPCAAPLPRPWCCAKENWASLGLNQDWFGRVWLNPPFHRHQVKHWVQRLADHGNGIALLHARTETAWFRPIWENAEGLLFLAERLTFLRPDGTPHSHNSGAPAVLAAFGESNWEILRKCTIAGARITDWYL